MNITTNPTPNFTVGRGGKKIDRIVLHWIVGTLAAADAVFAKDSSDVSAHYAIEDNEVHRYVAESDTAWHAGNYGYNQRSIGIEHSASPTRPASAQTIETSAQLVASIAKRHGISLDRTHVVKHSEVVPTQCCGTIPIDSIIARAKQINNPPQEVKVMVTQRILDVIVRLRLGRAPTAAEVTKYVGKVTGDQADIAIVDTQEYRDKTAAVKAAKKLLNDFRSFDMRNY